MFSREQYEQQALWRYAEAVTGCRWDQAGQIIEGPSFAAARMLRLC